MTSRALLGMVLFACILFQAALIAVPRSDGLLIGSDGIEYYIHLRSVVIDRDLDFANEYRQFSSVYPTPAVNALGRTPNKHAAVGVVLLWLPFFVLAHWLVLLLAQVGVPLVPDGYSYVYQAAVCLGSAMYGAWGCLLTYRAARRYYPEAPTTLALTVLWLASNAFYFMVFEPAMAHMLSLFAVSCALSIWFFRWCDADTPRLRDAVALGVASGLVMTVRTQDTVFLLIPAAFIGVRWVALWRQGDARRFRRWSLCIAVAVTAALVLFALQLYTWHQIYGVWGQSPMQNDSPNAFAWSKPHLLDVAFSTYHGLFTWHPVTLFATAGLLLLQRRDGPLAVALAVVFLLHLYVVAAWWGWAQGDSFGGRLFLNCFWLWGLGLSAVFAWASERKTRTLAVGALSVLLIGWNALSLIQYRLGFIAASTQPSAYEMTVGRLLVPARVLALVRHGSTPATPPPP